MVYIYLCELINANWCNPSSDRCWNLYGLHNESLFLAYVKSKYMYEVGVSKGVNSSVPQNLSETQAAGDPASCQG